MPLHLVICVICLICLCYGEQVNERFQLEANRDSHHRMTLGSVECEFSYRIHGSAHNYSMVMSLDMERHPRSPDVKIYECTVQRLGQHNHELHFIGFSMHMQPTLLDSHEVADKQGTLLEWDDYELDADGLVCVPGYNGDLMSIHIRGHEASPA
mmetsp:Transcript_63750/g.102627  ORF Transcript_63750/g.102627 Transcript_63750/m.102627 type:complete len:154 (-) Transcript_63750:368-829(-)